MAEPESLILRQLDAVRRDIRETHEREARVVELAGRMNLRLDELTSRVSQRLDDLSGRVDRGFAELRGDVLSLENRVLTAIGDLHHVRADVEEVQAAVAERTLDLETVRRAIELDR